MPHLKLLDIHLRGDRTVFGWQEDGVGAGGGPNWGFMYVPGRRKQRVPGVEVLD